MSGNPFYYFFQDIPYDVWMMLSTFLIAVLIIAIAICVVMYVFEALSLFTIAKRRGIPNYGLAWVPVGNMWIVGKLADQYDNYVKGKNMKLAPLTFGLDAGAVALFLLGLVSNFFVFWILGYLVAIAACVFFFISLSKIYHAANPSSAAVLEVLSIIFTVIIPFVLFAQRNKDEGYRLAAESWPPVNPSDPAERKQEAFEEAPKESAAPVETSPEPDDENEDDQE